MFLTSVLDTSRSSQNQFLAYLAELCTDLDSRIVDCTDANVYLSKSKLRDPDQPSFHEAMHGKDSEFWIEAMKTEVLDLLSRNTWERVLRSSVPRDPSGKKCKVLKSIWAFKLKRFPDGSPQKFKARFCARGDLQQEGVDFFDMYAPVVKWSTIRMLLIETLSRNWVTRQVDFTNAFAQGELSETVFLEPPKAFEGYGGLDKVLKLSKSLYGLRQAVKTFFEKLKDGLEERGFCQSSHNPCLFMKKDMMCVVYVDDTTFSGPNADDIEAEIKSIEICDKEQRHTFELRNEGEVNDFLGIRISKTGPSSYCLTQPGLIKKVLTNAGMENCKPASTPAVSTALGWDEHGKEFSENWDYASIIGMLMYLSQNTRPDIAFAVHQCARFTHNPMNSHAVGVKRILRYLKGTQNKGMKLCPDNSLHIDCYVDADFSGLWGSKYDQDPIFVKSRTIMYQKCPLHWVSRL